MLLSVGVRPESGLARAAGLDLNERGAVRVDEHLRTSAPGVYAVGDAIESSTPSPGSLPSCPWPGPRTARAGRRRTTCSAGRARAVHLHPGHHAGYFPGARAMHLKLVFAPDGRILGAQATGGEGVDKRIDVIATAIRAGLTVQDLAELELAYARTPSCASGSARCRRGCRSACTAPRASGPTSPCGCCASTAGTTSRRSPAGLATLRLERPDLLG